MRFQSGVVKRLAYRYGRNITLSNPGTTTTNLETGAVTRPFTSISVRGLCLPGDIRREHFNLSVAPNPTAYGGNYEVEDIRVVFTVASLGTFEITKQTVLTDGGHTYIAKDIRSVPAEYFDVVFHRVDDMDIGRQVTRPEATSGGS
jgi:hypothetical protein